MAWAPTLILTPMFLFLYLLQSHPAASTATLLHGGSHPAMVLPLYHSPPNIFTSSFSNSRRHLQRSTSNSHPSARMRLHDDLLLNGYYTTRLWIGTPPQQFALIVDTGSTVTYVPCATCEQCGRHQDPKFEPDLSSTYQPVKCNLDCNCDHDRVQCVYERQYAEMSSSSGVLGEDILSFGNQSELVPQRAVFGCENVETGDLYTQHADGIMGLGRGDLSVVDQLVEKGVISDSFSLCYGGMDIGGGAMVLGDISPPANMVFAHSDPVRSPYYNINLKAIRVAGKPLPLNPRVFDGKHGTVLDSGTTYAYLPEAAFVAFKDAIMIELQSLKQIHGPDPNYHDICFSGASSDASQLSNTFPAVEMVFGNGQKLLLSPENYLFRHSKVRGAYCLGIFQNGKDPTTLLGGIVVRNTLVMYDREHSKIGFWKTNCSELWERLQETGTPPQVPSSGKNPSAKLPPNEPSNYALPGVLRIGQITFDMSLSINYSNLEPHIPELTEFIAHELDVNTSQVHLLNVTSKGDSSLITWAIFPLGSASYISNDTAISIISQLAEHRVHLPDTFGNYKLLQWKIKPPAKRRWWQQQYLVAVLAITITMIVGLSAYGIWWFLWRQRQQTVNSYKPVDTAGPEQELQPL
ncbi:aspartic proteinase-like protein 2 [Pistacia vera]|uniref:aspartic proteinase-like protein 2 n=1 Tax=Pistacia vera TaxID=55513 RepID=UPI001263B79C|nr:aspartic proteinase-like protein 2 [Pistacia vera]